jgi:nitrite reductase/ring-hydroxylating ferredoxin subunit
MSRKFIELANTGDVAAGSMRCITVNGKGVLLANVQGTYYAADEMCTHEDARLCTGSLKDEYVKCPLHGSRFNLKTGKVMDEPADEDLHIYPVKIEGSKILICLD